MCMQSSLHQVYFVPLLRMLEKCNLHEYLGSAPFNPTSGPTYNKVYMLTFSYILQSPLYLEMWPLISVFKIKFICFVKNKHLYPESSSPH